MENTLTSPVRITILPADLEDNNLTPSELITLAGLQNKHFEKFGDINDFNSLEEKGFITQSKLQVKLTPKGKSLIIKLLEINSTIKFNRPRVVRAVEVEQISQIDDSFVAKYRSLFKGTKVGAMGSEKGVKHKLERFLREHKQATPDIIIEATRRYINSLDSYRYIQQADYFIYKRDNLTMDESSRLSAFVDEVLANPNQEDDDWTTRIV